MAPRDQRREGSLAKLNRLLALIHQGPNKFQAARYPRSVKDWRDFETLPFTTKADLVADQKAKPPFGSNLSYPLEQYSRFCQTSGTSGEPLAWIDTPESWESMLRCWRQVYQAAGVTARDRLYFAFSFGPFLGFWTAFEAATSSGYFAMPGGGLGSLGRLQAMEQWEASVLCCTPTYALRLGDLAREHGIALPKLRLIIVAGEPGGSIPALRHRIAELFQGKPRVFDHHGLTEVGPVSYEHPRIPCSLLIMEEAYLAEVLNPKTNQEVADGELGELVLTTLDRLACPLIRYRTGDLVRKRRVPELTLEGGILGRIDDMVVIRGVNLYPSAIDAIIREFADIGEYQVVQTTHSAMNEISVEVELHGEDKTTLDRLADTLRQRLSLRIPVHRAEPGQLPRHEFKAKRWLKR